MSQNYDQMSLNAPNVSSPLALSSDCGTPVDMLLIQESRRKNHKRSMRKNYNRMSLNASNVLSALALNTDCGTPVDI